MKQPLVAMFDAKASQFGAVFAVASVGVAIRDFQAEINNPDQQSNLSKYPEDFSLFQVGVFDTDNGKLDVVLTQSDIDPSQDVTYPVLIASGHLLKVSGVASV